MRPARGWLSLSSEWIVSYSDWRVRHIMCHVPPPPAVGVVTLLRAGTGQTPCGQVVCHTSPHAPGTRPLAGEAVGGGQRAASQAPAFLTSATRAAPQAHNIMPGVPSSARLGGGSQAPRWDGPTTGRLHGLQGGCPPESMPVSTAYILDAAGGV